MVLELRLHGEEVLGILVRPQRIGQAASVFRASPAAGGFTRTEAEIPHPNGQGWVSGAVWSKRG